MDPKEIKMRLLEREITQMDIARQENVAPSTVNQTITGRTVSARLRRAIAEAIGVPVEKIWPPEETKHEAA